MWKKGGGGDEVWWDGSLTCNLERGGKGHLIPEAGAIAVTVPEGQMCSRCQKGPKGALIIFSLMTLLFISSTQRSICVRG